MTMKALAVAAILALGNSIASAATPTWVDWSSASTGTMGSTNVTLTGPALDWIDGATYFSNTATNWNNPGGTYAALGPSDLIRIDQVALNGGSTFTLSFSQMVGSLYLALVSVGQPSLGVTYTFNDPVQVISFGNNYWGYGSYSLVDKTFTGNEFNGILRLDGNFGPSHSLSFTVQQPEYWHGFNVAAIPEPETYAMMLAGLGVIGAIARRRRQVKTAA